MVAHTRSFCVEDLSAQPVRVQVDVRPALPVLALVGLPDGAARATRERAQAAALNSGLCFPGRRITARIAPADIPRSGAGLDLALAIALLGASGQLDRSGSPATPRWASSAWMAAFTRFAAPSRGPQAACAA